MASNTNRVHLLCYVKLDALQSHWWIQTGVRVRKRTFRAKIVDLLSRVTSKFDEWSWKTIGHLLGATSSCVRHFVPISQFKLELQSGNTQFGSKSAIFCPVWPRNLNYFYTTSSFADHFKTISEFTLELQSGNAEFGSKSAIFLSRVTLKFDGWFRKTIGHLFYATSSFVHHFLASCKFKLELRSGNGQIWAKFVLTSDLDLLYGHHFCQW